MAVIVLVGKLLIFKLLKFSRVEMRIVNKKRWNTVDYIILTLTVLDLAGAIAALVGAIVYFAGFKQYLMITFLYVYNILLLVFFTTILSKVGGKKNDNKKGFDKRKVVE
jgi:hypothetical protein